MYICVFHNPNYSANINYEYDIHDQTDGIFMRPIYNGSSAT